MKGKKLSLKERLALKKKKKLEEKQKKEKKEKDQIPDEDPQLSTEEFEQQKKQFESEIWATYNSYLSKFNENKENLAYYKDMDKSKMSPEEK